MILLQSQQVMLKHLQSHRMIILNFLRICIILLVNLKLSQMILLILLQCQVHLAAIRQVVLMVQCLKCLNNKCQWMEEDITQWRIQWEEVREWTQVCKWVQCPECMVPAGMECLSNLECMEQCLQTMACITQGMEVDSPWGECKRVLGEYNNSPPEDFQQRHQQNQHLDQIRLIFSTN